MSTHRRDFMKAALATGAIPAFLPELWQQSAPSAGAQLQPDQRTVDFWNSFLQKETLPSATIPGRTRGPATGGLDREPFFFHYGRSGFQPAMDIPATDLQADGDVSLSLNVAAFRPARADQTKIETLQAAQLRIDLLQNVPILDVLDTMAWTAVAMLHPGSNKKLPPIQNLSFDPGTAWQKMQNVVLPRGNGRWAVNLYAQQRDGFFSTLVKTVTKEMTRWSPVLGLPGISMIALQSFNAFYGLFHTRPEYLFQSNPVPMFGTQLALKTAASNRGVPLKTGSYLLVPVGHASEMASEKLEAFELRQGLIVPKGTLATDIYKAAGNVMPDVTYATIEMVVKGVQTPCAK